MVPRVPHKSTVNAILLEQSEQNCSETLTSKNFINTWHYELLLWLRCLRRFFLLSAAVKDQHLTRTVTGIFDGWFSLSRINRLYHRQWINSWACNGAIINNRFVITQATCVYRCENFKIRVGSIVHGAMNVTIDGIVGEYVTKWGTKPYFAPGYLPGYQEHDLALLETDSQIIYSQSVTKVILLLYNSSALAANTQVVATGFGQFHKYNPWWELQYLTLDVFDNSQFLSSPMQLMRVYMRRVRYNRTLRGSLCEEIIALWLVCINQYSVPMCEYGGPEMFLAIAPYVRWIRETARFDTLDSDIYQISFS